MTSPSELLPNETKKWSHKYDQCVVCESTKYPYIESGLCSRCYNLAKKNKEHTRDILLKRRNQHLASQQISSTRKVNGIIERNPIERQRDPSISKQWSRKHDRCIKCSDNQSRHIARGLCINCYQRETEERHRGGHNYQPIKEKLTYEYIFEEYINKKRSLGEIAKDCNCTRQNICKKLKLWEIPARDRSEARDLAHERGKVVFKIEDERGNIEEIVKYKIKLNETFFSEWSNEMAWVLGLIYTDGNLFKISNRVSISQKEPEILNKVLTLMRCDAKLMYRERKEYKNTVAGELYTFSISNKKIYDDLTRIGLTPNKSRIIEFPQVPDEYLRHFIRGCWDGDGSVSIARQESIDTKPEISASFVSGSRKFIESMAKELEKAGLSKDKKIQLQKGSYSIRYNGNLCKMLYHYFYDHVSSDQYLERKYQVFIEYFKRSYKFD